MYGSNNPIYSADPDRKYVHLTQKTFRWIKKTFGLAQKAKFLTILLKISTLKVKILK